MHIFVICLIFLYFMFSSFLIRGNKQHDHNQYISILLINRKKKKINGRIPLTFFSINYWFELIRVRWWRMGTPEWRVELRQNLMSLIHPQFSTISLYPSLKEAKDHVKLHHIYQIHCLQIQKVFSIGQQCFCFYCT